LTQYASLTAEAKLPLLRTLAPTLSSLLSKLEEHPRVLAQLKSPHCNPKSVYWELPAFAAPDLGKLAQEIKAATERLHGWLFLDELARALGRDRLTVANLVKLASLLQVFGCRLADGRLVCTDHSRADFLRHLHESGKVPGPARSLETPIKAYLGRSLSERTLAALLGQTLSPGVVVELDRQMVVFSLDRAPSVRDLLLGGMRLWKGPLSSQELFSRLARLEFFNATDLEGEMELHGLKAEGLLDLREGLFVVASARRNGGKPKPSSSDVANLVFQTLFQVATADQVVRPEEMAVIANLLAVEFEIDFEAREPFEDLLKLATQRSLGHEELGQPLSPEQIRAFPQELRDRVFRGAVAVAFIDLEVHQEERRALEGVAQRLQTSLPGTSVVARFEEMFQTPHTELAYFGILPDLTDPQRLAPKLTRLQQYTLERLAAQSLPESELQRIHQLLSGFSAQHPAWPKPWLLQQDLQQPALPAPALLPLHCLLRVARADGPLNAQETRAIEVLIRACLPELSDQALWTLCLPQIPQLAVAPPPVEQPEIRFLSFALVVALCDGPLNVEKSRELLSLASLLGVSEQAFLILHRLEQAAREHLRQDPELEQLPQLIAALEEAENPPPGEHAALSSPLIIPELQPGGQPLLLIVRPSGKHNFIMHCRVRPELQDVPFLSQRLQQEVEQRPGLSEICQGRNWGLCKGVALCMKILQEVKDSPFEVQWPHGQPFQVLGKVGLHNLSASIAEKQGWFEIGGKLQLGMGHSLSLIELLERFRQNQETIALNSDTFVQLDEPLRLQLSRLDRLLPPDRPGLSLDPVRARLVAGEVSFLEDQTQNLEFSRLGALLEEARELKPELPPEVWDQLRDYQKEGVLWLLRTTHAGLGACLADDMGLGKTLQTLCLLHHRRSRGVSLVVAPTSVTYNWKEQAQRFFPQLRVWLYEGQQATRHADLERAQDYDVVVASYGLLHRDHSLLQPLEWNCLVLDEAQKIKNPNSATARAAFTMTAQARVATTGTPVENHLLELWSLMNFLNPGLLGTQNAFRQAYLGRGPEIQDSDRIPRLRAQIGHFILRRRKETVAPQLPAKTETIHRLDLSPAERDMYNAIRAQALLMDRLDRISLLAALTRLRQACCDPALIEGEWEGISSKLSAAVEILAQVTTEGHGILVFSQFVTLLQRLAQQLEAEGLPYRELYGSTLVEERRALVEEFQQGGFPIFLISLKAGGTGLTLTRADYVLHLDPWWNPAVEDQATDRAHRIGQTQTVHVIRLIARETVEEKVLDLHASKRELAEAVLDQNGNPGQLSLEDLRALF